MKIIDESSMEQESLQLGDIIKSVNGVDTYYYLVIKEGGGYSLLVLNTYTKITHPYESLYDLYSSCFDPSTDIIVKSDKYSLKIEA